MGARHTALEARAEAVLAGPRPQPVAESTEREYARVCARLLARAEATGALPRIEAMATSRTAWNQMRAAWSRLAFRTVEGALADLRAGAGEDARRRLLLWTSVAEDYPHQAGGGGWRPGAPRSRWHEEAERRGISGENPHRKRELLAGLPPEWLAELWSDAALRGFPHLDALAVLVCTGARPAEISAGVVVTARPGSLEFEIAGAKVRDDGTGQPWRRLRVAAPEGEPGGPAARLRALCGARGSAVVAGPRPGTLSQGIADLAGGRWGRRISAYDVRHQRASDARLAFGGDRQLCALWLGHTDERTARYYAALPRRSRLSGPRPLAAEAPRPVRPQPARFPPRAPDAAAFDAPEA